MNKPNFIMFRSFSGDWFSIPSEYADEEIKVYNYAVNSGFEHTMLLFESGLTGWKYIEG